jgi:hypothetical protein
MSCEFEKMEGEISPTDSYYSSILLETRFKPFVPPFDCFDPVEKQLGFVDQR